jgi:hypothetical protein
VAAGTLAGGYLLYPTRTRPVAIPTSESRQRQRGGQRVGDGGVAVGQRVNEQVGELSRVLPEKFGFLTGFASLTLSRLTLQN